MPLLKQTEQKQHEQGQILLLLLLIVSIALVIALGLVQLSVTQRQTIRYEDYSLRAYYAAEAGIEDVLPKFEEISRLSGKKLDEYLANPANGMTVDIPQVLGEDSQYTFTRTVGRGSVERIERTVLAEETSQFDLSDSEDVFLEGSELEIRWSEESLNDTCDDAGNCQTAVEATLVWEVEPTVNSIYNPSFEVDNDANGVAEAKAGRNWDKISGGDFAIETGYVYKGTYSQMITADAGDPLEVGLTRAPVAGNLIPVQADTIYTLSVYVYVDSLSGGTVQLDVDVWDAGLVNNQRLQLPVIGEKYLDKKTGIYWERLYITFQTASDGVWLQPFFFFSEDAIGTVFIDAMQLEAGQSATAYCDGDQKKGRWLNPATQPFSESAREEYYEMERYFYDARTPPICEQCCTPPCPGTTCYNNYARSCGDWDTTDKTVEVLISLDEPSANRSLRIRSMFNPIDLSLRARNPTWPDITYRLVGQEIVVTSTGYFADTRKTLQVSHGLPSLKSTFDYVVFNYACADGGCMERDLIK
ncbi:MAG TPA: pilus assembly PilX N-terminal domain-containing protein [bacterium]|nr:pilus assembly PilX N-terminal domain-containing protein [bacterium]